MGVARETANLWWWIANKYNYRSTRSFRRLIGMPYFWQDSFLTPFNRAIWCRIFGHGKQSWIDDDNGEDRRICWRCYMVTGRRKSKFYPQPTNVKVPIGRR